MDLDPTLDDVDSEYEMFRELAGRVVEHPLDQAVRTGDLALRCYYVEHGEKATKKNWDKLAAVEKGSYRRLPVQRVALPSGTFFWRTFDDKIVEMTPQDARKNPMISFVAL